VVLRTCGVRDCFLGGSQMSELKPCSHTKETRYGMLDAVNPTSGQCEECGKIVRYHFQVKDWRPVVRLCSIPEVKPSL